MFFDTDGSHFFSPIRGGVNLLRNRGVNLTGIINFEYLNDEGYIYQSKIVGLTDFNLKNDFTLPDVEQLEGDELVSLAIAAFKELDKKKKFELLNKLREELEDKIKKSS